MEQGKMLQKHVWAQLKGEDIEPKRIIRCGTVHKNHQEEQ